MVYRGLLCLLFGGILSIKQCSEKKKILFIIDSTNQSTSRDFSVQVDIVRYVVNEFEPNKLTVGVRVYSTNDSCLNTGSSTSNNEFFGTSNHDLIKSKLNFLEHRASDSNFYLNCAEKLVNNTPDLLSTKQQVFSVILAKYESAKTYIHQSEYPKFKTNGSYYVAFMYNSSNIQVDAFARRDSNINDMYSAIMRYVCPEYIKVNSKVNSTLMPSKISYTPRSSSIQNDVTVSNQTFHDSVINMIVHTTTLQPSFYQPIVNIATVSLNQSKDTAALLKSKVASDVTNVQTFSNTLNQSIINASSDLVSRLVMTSMTTSDLVSRLVMTSMRREMSKYVINSSYFETLSLKTNELRTATEGIMVSSNLLIQPSRVESTNYLTTTSFSKFLSSSNVYSSYERLSINHTTLLNSRIDRDSINVTRSKRWSIKNTSSTASSTILPTLSYVSMNNLSASTERNISEQIIFPSSMISSKQRNFSTFLVNQPNVSNRYNVNSTSLRIENTHIISTSTSPKLSITINSTVLYQNTSSEFQKSPIVLDSSSIGSGTIIVSTTSNTTVHSKAAEKSTSVKHTPHQNISPVKVTMTPKTHSNITKALTSILHVNITHTSKFVITSTIPFFVSSSIQLTTLLRSTTASSSYSSDVITNKTTPTTSTILTMLLRSTTASSSYSSNVITNKTTPTTSTILSSAQSHLQPNSTLFTTGDNGIFTSTATFLTFSNVITNKTTSITSTVSTSAQPHLEPSPTLFTTGYNEIFTSTATFFNSFKNMTLTSTSFGSYSYDTRCSMGCVTPTTVVVPTSLASSSRIVPLGPTISLENRISDFIQQNFTIDQLTDRNWTTNFVKNSSKLLKVLTLTGNQSNVVGNASIDLVHFIEATMLKVGHYLPEKEVVELNEGEFSVQISTVDTNLFDGYQFKPSENSVENIQLPKTLFKSYSNDSAVIVGMSYNVLPAMRITRGLLRPSYKVIALTVDPPIRKPLEEPLSYRMEIKEHNASDYQCVFWNTSEWDTSGCVLANVTGSLVTCECNHMTSFSILMQVTDYEVSAKHRFILSIITYVGCGVSITACVILILTYMMCGRLVKIDRNIIHINLALAIAISNGLFICADSVFKYHNICLGVSIAMYYSYLASFFWMLVEGLHVYLMIIKVFKSSRKMKVYITIGWILPAIITVLIGFKFHDKFTRDDFCWLSLESNVIWAFVGPALFVLVVNTCILIGTLNASHKMSVDETEFSKLQRIARLTLLLMPIFGLTWIFGVLAINNQLIWFQYIFTGINSFQGLFIFICYCILNNEVKREYQRVRRKSQYSSSKSNGFSDSGFTSHHQRKRLKSALSMEDILPTVQLTRYDIYDSNYSSYLLHDRNHIRTAPNENISDTLTKRHKKQYSIELMKLQDGGDDRDSVCSFLPSEEVCLLRTSTFDASSRVGSDRQSSIGDTTEECAPYKTFCNEENGKMLIAYRV